jgi:hypothetical protein
VKLYGTTCCHIQEVRTLYSQRSVKFKFKKIFTFTIFMNLIFNIDTRVDEDE